MHTKRESLIERVAALPEELLDEVEQSIDVIVRWHAPGTYRLSDEERAGVRRGLAAAERGEFASESEVRHAPRRLSDKVHERAFEAAKRALRAYQSERRGR